MDDLALLDAVGCAQLVRAGTVSPAEVVDAALERIDRLDPALNAVIARRDDRARADAADPDLPDGPFRGVPALLKDLGSPAAGDPYWAGSRFLHRLGWVSDHDGHLVARMRRAGMVLCGRTNTPELGSVPTTEPEEFGATRNPWDAARSPGGSSGGSAAAVAAGLVPAATGGDGGGSIRVPASACGLVGLKASRGRVSLAPDAGEGWGGFSVLGFVTRSVRDAAALLDVVAVPPPGEPYAAPALPRPLAEEVGTRRGQLRVGLMTSAPGDVVPVDPEVQQAVAAAGELLESLGHAVETSYPPALDEVDPMRRAFGRVVAVATAAALDDWARAIGRPVTADDVEPMNWAIAERGRRRSATDHLESLGWLHGWTRRVAAWWDPEGGEGLDVLVTPTMPEPPIPLGQMRSTPEDPLGCMQRASQLVAFTSPFNATGQPAVSLPLHWTAGGLPVGVQLVAPLGREDVLVGVAAALEEAAPWADRRPPVAPGDEGAPR